MGHSGRIFSRCTALLLVCALLTPSAAFAKQKPLTPEEVHARLLRHGIGNWVGVQVLSGAAFAGRLVSIDDKSFGLQLHNDPTITPVLYTDVTYLQTGLTGGQKVLIIGLPLAVAGAGIGTIIAMRRNQPHIPTMSTLPVAP
jgi:hypothetical protein